MTATFESDGGAVLPSLACSLDDPEDQHRLPPFNALVDTGHGLSRQAISSHSKASGTGQKFQGYHGGDDDPILSYHELVH